MGVENGIDPLNGSDELKPRSTKSACTKLDVLISKLRKRTGLVTNLDILDGKYENDIGDYRLLATEIWKAFEIKKERSCTTLQLLFKITSLFLKIRQDEISSLDSRDIHAVASRLLVRRILKSSMDLIQFGLKSGKNKLINSTLDLLTSCALESAYSCEMIWGGLKWSSKLLKEVFGGNKASSDSNKLKKHGKDLKVTYTVFILTLLKCSSTSIRCSIIDSSGVWGWNLVFKHIKDIKEITFLNLVINTLKQCATDRGISDLKKNKFFSVSLLRELFILYKFDNVAQGVHDLMCTMCCVPHSGIFTRYVVHDNESVKRTYDTERESCPSMFSLRHKKLHFVMRHLKPNVNDRKQDLVVNICAVHPGLTNHYFCIHNSFISAVRPSPNEIWVNFASLIARIVSQDIKEEGLALSSGAPPYNFLLDITLPSVVSKNILISGLLHTNKIVKYTTSIILCCTFHKMKKVLAILTTQPEACRIKSNSNNYSNNYFNLQVAERYISLLYKRLPDFQVILNQLMSLKVEQPLSNNNEVLNKAVVEAQQQNGYESPDSKNEVRAIDNENSRPNTPNLEQDIPKSLHAALLRLIKNYLVYCPLKLDSIRFNPRKLYTPNIGVTNKEVILELMDIVIVTSASGKWHVRSPNMNSSMLEELLKIYVIKYPHLAAKEKHKFEKALKVVLKNSPLFEKREQELEIFSDLLEFFKFIPAGYMSATLSWLSTALCTGLSQTYQKPANTVVNDGTCLPLYTQNAVVEFLGSAVGSLLKKHLKNEFSFPLLCAITSWVSNYFCILIANGLATTQMVNSVLEKILSKFLPNTPHLGTIVIPLGFLQDAAKLKVHNMNSDSENNRISIIDLDSEWKVVQECDTIESLFDFLHTRKFKDLGHILLELLEFASKDDKKWAVLEAYIFFRHPLEGSIFTNLLRMYGRISNWPELARKCVFEACNNFLLVNFYITTGDSSMVMSHILEAFVYVAGRRPAPRIIELAYKIANILALKVKAVEYHTPDFSLLISALKQLLEGVKQLNITDCCLFDAFFTSKFLLDFLFAHLSPSCAPEVRDLSISLTGLLSDMIKVSNNVSNYPTSYKMFVKQYSSKVINIIETDSYLPHPQQIIFLATKLGIDEVISLVYRKMCTSDVLDTVRIFLSDNKCGPVLSVEFPVFDEMLRLADGELLFNMISGWISGLALKFTDINIFDKLHENVSGNCGLRVHSVVALGVGDERKTIEVPFIPNFSDEVLKKLCVEISHCNRWEITRTILESGILPLPHIINYLLENKSVSDEVLSQVIACMLVTQKYTHYFKTESGLSLKSALITQRLCNYIIRLLSTYFFYPCHEYIQVPKYHISHIKLLVSESPYFFIKKLFLHKPQVPSLEETKIWDINPVEITKIWDVTSHYFTVFSQSCLTEDDAQVQAFLIHATLIIAEQGLKIYSIDTKNSIIECTLKKLLSTLCDWCKIKIPDRGWVKHVANVMLMNEEHTKFLYSLFDKLLEYGRSCACSLELLSHLSFWLFRYTSNNPEETKINYTYNFDSFCVANLILNHPTFKHTLEKVEESIIANEIENCYNESMIYLLDTLNFTISGDYISIYKKAYIEKIVNIYGASQSPIDQKILQFLFTLESEGHISVNESLMNWKNTRRTGCTHILKSLDAIVMLHTIEYFDIFSSLEYSVDMEPIDNKLYLEIQTKARSKHHSRINSTLYDPRFLIPFAASILQNEKHTEMKQHLLALNQSNILGLSVACCSSLSHSMRKAGFFFLNIYQNQLNKCKTSLELYQIKIVLNSLKYSISAEPGQIQRIPRLTAFFVAQSLFFIVKPESFMYKPLNKFFLKKPVLELDRPHMFDELFNSSDNDSRQKRLWILHIFSRGLHCIEDYKNYAKKNILNILISAYNSPFCDTAMRNLVLSIFNNVSTIQNLGNNVLKTTSLAFFIDFEFKRTLSHKYKDLNVPVNLSTIILNLSKNVEINEYEGIILGHMTKSCIMTLNLTLNDNSDRKNTAEFQNFISEFMTISVALSESITNIREVYDRSFLPTRDLLDCISLLISISTQLDRFVTSHLISSKMGDLDTSLRVRNSQLKKILLRLIFTSDFCDCLTNPGTYSHENCYLHKTITFCVKAVSLLESYNELPKDVCLDCANWMDNLALKMVSNVAFYFFNAPKLLSNLLGLALRLQLSGFEPVWHKLHLVATR